MVVPYYRPLNRISYLLDFQLFGMRAWGFHAVNVALHLLNVLVLRRLGLILFDRREAPALLTALLFAVHPINTEAVDFIVCRNNLFALLFVLLALLPLLEGEPDRLGARAWRSGVMWFLALLSKESAATAVLLFAAVLAWGPWTAGTTRRQRLLALAPHALFAGLYLVMRRLALGDVVGRGLSVGHLAQAFWINVQVIPRYLELLVFPARLNHLHQLPEAGSGVEPGLLLAWLLLAGALAFLLVRRTVPSTVGLLWIAASYIPISNLVPIPSYPMAERYLYLPAVGVWIIAGDRLWAAWSGGRRRWLAAGTAVALLLLASVTIRRNLVWRDDLTLFESVVRADPGSATGHYNLGCALRERGDLARARREWERTLEVDPRHAGALTQLGTAAAIEGDLPRAERFYRAAIGVDSGQATALFNLARILDKTGRRREAVEVYDHFLRSAGAEEAVNVPFARARRAELAGGLLPADRP
jgi:hypothetical protein